MKNKSFKYLLFVVAILHCLFFLSCKPTTKEVSKPNVIYIFPDQFRQYSLGFWSEGENRKHINSEPDPVQTPNLDQLAKEGVVFSKSVSNFPLCSPYRGMLLSGKYPEHNGIWNNCRSDRDVSLKEDLNCITDVFQDAGYNTAYIGKTHFVKPEPAFDSAGNYLGITESPGGHYISQYGMFVPPGKKRHSIEYFTEVHGDHFNHYMYSSDPALVDGKKDGEIHHQTKYTPQNESEIIIEYLKNSRKQRDANKPFLMIWSINPPHAPWRLDQCHLESYNKYYSPDKFGDLSNLYVRENVDSTVDSYAPYYFANVTGVDKYIGEVLKALKELGMEENTIVVFSSDHGEMLNSNSLGGKNVINMESFAIPLIVKWPKKLKHRIESMLINVPDMMPTLISLAGLDNMPDDLDGVDFSKVLIDQTSTSVKKHTSSLYMGSTDRGVMTDRYTLKLNVESDDISQSYIYDNESDPYQLHKIPFADNPELTSLLLKELAYWLVKSNDPWYQHKTRAELIPYDQVRL